MPASLRHLHPDCASAVRGPNADLDMTSVAERPRAVPVARSREPLPNDASVSMRVTQIGHSTVLVEAAGTRLILDPYFGRRGNPAYRRRVPAARSREACLDVDAVLISHAHFDHVDRRYLRAIGKDVPVFAPCRVAWLIALMCGREIESVIPWRQFMVGKAYVIPVTARHTTPGVGYVISIEGKTLYFAGDTYVGRFMKEVGDRFHPDVCLMPVARFRIPTTMGNAGAIEAARLIRPRTIIPIHLGLEPRLPALRRAETAESFRRLARRERLAADIVSLEPGESYSW
jgi:L-ascorbate metabolism protein UlaG (beta-lactamase superfamily)